MTAADCSFNTSMLRKELHSVLQSAVYFEKNLLMPEDVAFISSKSEVDTLRDDKVMSAARTDGQTDQTDGFSALYSRLAMYLPYRAGVDKC